MSQPLTLWDYGMMNMERDAKEVVDYIETDGIWWTWVRYSWDNNEIEIRLIVQDFNGTVSHQTCNETRRSLIAALSGVYSMANEKNVRERMHAEINRWFSHKGFASKSRDEKLAEKLARIIFVEVVLRNDDGGISCRDRIMTFDAASKPL